MQAGSDPYASLGVARGATDAAIHAGYRAAVRRTHPDAGGSAAAFEAVQEAYELLRDPRRRRAWDAGHPDPWDARESPRRPATDAGAAHRAMEDLLAESQRLEDELAGVGRRRGRPNTGAGAGEGDEEEDSVGAVLRDAGQQLSATAGQWSRELGRLFRRLR
jgi:curved DNA-binding protein CbpA